MNDKKRVKNIKIIFAILTMILLSLPFWLTPQPMTLKDFDTSDILQLLTAIFIIALVIERSLEIFLSTFRAEGSIKLKTEIHELEKDKRVTTDEVKLAEIENKLKIANNNRDKRRIETMMISMWSGLCLGVLVSAIGVRVLRFLFSPLSFTEVGDTQLGFFNVVDVFVTGGLIAGGSDQIHKIMRLIREVLDFKTEEVEKKKVNTKAK